MSATVIHADCRDALREMADASVDAVVCDPPYGLSFMGRAWDYDVPGVDVWREVLRVVKPGGHLLAFFGSRTYHRGVVAIEDAGFEIRDCVMWLYGQGFPKSLDVSKAIDKAAGAEGGYGAPKSAAHAGWIDRGRMRGENNEEGWQRPWMDDPAQVDKAARQYLPATDAARQWEGWGTALKPSHEPIVVARKPLIGTVSENVTRWGTGAINIDGCRVGASGGTAKGSKPTGDGNGIYGAGLHGACDIIDIGKGRWPANVIHDGSDEVMEAFSAFGGKGGGFGKRGAGGQHGVYSPIGGTMETVGFGDTGTAARFFYAAKASAKDRAGSRHPTVKPLALMRYLCRLVTPPGGVVLDPFAGSGTTLQAAVEEGFRAIGIEREAEYVADIHRRLESVKAPEPAPASDQLALFAAE